MASTPPEGLKEKLSEILRANDIHDEVSSVRVTKPDLKGQHMASIIELAEIEFRGGGREPLRLFIKKTLQNMPPGFAALMAKIMVCEGAVMKDLAREMKEFCEERKGGPDLTDLFPRVYYYDEEMIVMEDISVRGFSTLPRKPLRNFEEVRIVFEKLAVYHAVSYVMIQVAGGPNKFIENHPYLQSDKDLLSNPEMKTIISSFGSTFTSCLRILKNSSQMECQEKGELLGKYSGKLWDVYVQVNEAESRVLSMIHDDCWNNNVMFDRETKKKLILIDLQGARVNSPAFDLARFLFCSGAPDVRKKWKELLQIYFDKFKGIVLGLGQPFPLQLEDFVADFSVKAKIDFLFSIIFVIGSDAIANHDTVNGSTDFGGDVQGLVTRWMDNNPDKMESAAAEMVELVNDFLLFGTL